MTAPLRAEPRRARRRRGGALTRGARVRSADDAFAAFRGLIDDDATPTSKRRWTAALRALAGDAFVSDRDQRTLSWWAERLHGLVARKTVERWSSLDGWIARREVLLGAVRDEVFKTMVSQAVRDFVADLEGLDRLHSALTAQLEGRDNVIDVPVLTKAGELVVDAATGRPRTKRVEVAPTAFTTRMEAVRALVALDQRRDEKRRLVLGVFLPAASTSPAPPDFATSLSPTVARAMARAKLLAERAEIVDEAAGRSADE